MFYKRFCSSMFTKELNDIYKYATIDLKSLVGWQMIKRYIMAAIIDGESPIQYQESRNIRLKCDKEIKRITVDNYTVFYGINHDKKEIYLLNLLYRKY